MLSALLDVAIGLVLVFLVMSVAVSAASEVINNLLQRRAKELERFIGSLLLNSQINPQDFYKNTSIAPQARGERKPNYIQASDFVDALLTSLHSQNKSIMGGQLPDLTVDSLKRVVATMPDSAPLKKVLASALAKPNDPAVKAVDEMARVRAALEKWFDNSMERVSGWFKLRTQYLILGIGLLLAIVFNVDTIAISNNLLRNPALRSAIAARAGATGQSLAASIPGATPQAVTPGETTPPQSNQSFLADLQLQLAGLDMPIGWPDPGLPTADFGWWLKKVIGILITGFAVSQGAPFWFDMLNRITSLRGGGPPPEKSSASLPVNPPDNAPTKIEVTTTPGPVVQAPPSDASAPPSSGIVGTSPGNAAETAPGNGDESHAVG